MRGDVVVVVDSTTPLRDVEGVALPPPGVLGHVECVNEEDRTVVIDFPISGRHIVAADSLPEGAVVHAYAERIETAGAPLVDLRALPTLESGASQNGIELIR